MGEEYKLDLDNKEKINKNSIDGKCEYKTIVNDSWYINNKNVVISIIIPSHNRYPLNLFSLYSLEKQIFDINRMEVIFLDDSSTDDTYSALEKYKAPFPFCYVCFNKNLGRAKVRNKGIEIARGEIIIFLDAEMITETDFVMNHYKSHRGKDKLVVTGAFHLNNIYTCIFPQFNMTQLSTIRKLAKTDEALYIKYNYYNKMMKKGFAKVNKPLVFFNKREIQQQRYKSLMVKNYHFYDEILAVHGEELKGFCFPWMAFLTGNVSVKKDFIQAVGGFDNDFIKYGYEDWELGYRLYKNGAKFVGSKSVATYHQEHPVSTDKWNEAVVNYYLFTKKHFDVDVLVLGLELARIMDLQSINKILLEYRELQKDYYNEFTDFNEGFLKILETVAILLRYDIRHKLLFEASGINKYEKKGILLDIESMKKTNKFNQLTALLEHKII